MNAAAMKGNSPEQWQRLLDYLDDKLQLGLLDYLTRINAYHFEDDILFIEPGSESDETYLSKASNFQQLELLAQAATGVDKVKIKKLSVDPQS